MKSLFTFYKHDIFPLESFFYEGNCEMSLSSILFAEITQWGWGVCGWLLWHGREFWDWCLWCCMLREGPNERPALQIALQRTISSLQVCALFLLHRSNVTNYILFCLSTDISVTLFCSQLHILSARAAPDLDFLSDKTEIFNFLVHLDILMKYLQRALLMILQVTGF